MNTELLKSKLLEAAFNGSLTHADTSKWVQVALNRVCSHQNGDRGKNYPSKNKLSHVGIPFISALNLSNNTVVDDDKLLKMTESQYDKLSNGKLKKGDLVLCIRGSIGKHGIYPFEKGAIASSLVILRPNENKLSVGWLSYYLDTSLFQESLLIDKNGSAQPNLAASELMNFILPLPPVDEQEKIISTIEEGFAAIDAIAAAKENLSTTAEMLRSKILQSAFDGSLVGNTEGWKWSKGKDFFLPLESAFPQGETFKYIDIDAIDNKKCRIREIKILPVKEAPSRASRKTRKGDVLFSMVRPYLKNIAMVTEDDCIASTGFFVCRPSKSLDSKYCYYLMTSDMVVQGLNFYMKGDNSPSIRKGELLNFEYPLPPLAEQQRIVAKIEELFEQIDKISK